MAIVKIINSPRSQNLKGLHGVLSYCCRDAKTNQGGHKLISGVNCVPQFALQEFMNTKRLHKQNSGRMYYHMVQSFSPEENITPETAHEIALKLAETIPGFEIVVATHRDAHHVHSHFVINSVSFETGKKYHSDPESLQALWDASDALCLQYGLSVIQKKKGKKCSMNDREYRAYERGDSWKMALEIAIDDCMTIAQSREHFLQLMEWRGYGVTWTDTRKNITYTTPQGYKCRDRKLNGRKYLKEEMEYEFEQRAQICRRYAREAKTESSTGGSGAENRRRYGTQLAGADRVAENGDGNRSADFGKAGHLGDTGRADLFTGTAARCTDAVAAGDDRCGTRSSEGCVESNAGRAGSDADRNQSNRSALWASEREVFESNLRRAGTPAQVDAEVSADQSHSQRAANHPVVDAAYLIGHLSDIIDVDDPDDYYAQQMRRGYRGPTLSM